MHIFYYSITNLVRYVKAQNESRVKRDLAPLFVYAWVDQPDPSEKAHMIAAVLDDGTVHYWRAEMNVFQKRAVDRHGELVVDYLLDHKVLMIWGEITNQEFEEAMTWPTGVF